MAYIILDIKTVPRPDIMDTWFPAWAESKGIKEENIYGHAALFPEFGQVVCIGTKMFDPYKKANDVLGTTDCVGTAPDLEKSLLESFAMTLNASAVNGSRLVGHNIKGFDVPFLVKRMLAHGIIVPDILVQGKHLDTMELMKFGGRSNMSLRAYALLLGLDDPKADSTGSHVYEYLEAGDYDRVQKYCMGDVDATYDVFRALYLNGCVC